LYRRNDWPHTSINCGTDRFGRCHIAIPGSMAYSNLARVKNYKKHEESINFESIGRMLSKICSLLVLLHPLLLQMLSPQIMTLAGFYLGILMRKSAA